MIVDLLSQFATYLLISIILRLVLSLLPATIGESFSIITEFRQAITRFVQSMYQTKGNFEVNITAVFIVPFVLLLIGYSTLSTFVYLNTDHAIMNIWAVIFLIYILANMAPHSDDLQSFRDVSPSSLFLFFFKLALIFQLSSSYSNVFVDVVAIILAVTPVSAYLSN